MHPPEQRGNHGPNLLVQVTTTLLCLSLLGGVVRVAHGVPCRQLKSMSVATRSMGFLGAISCCPPVDFFYAVWVGDTLTSATLELGFDPSCFASAVMRSRVHVFGACLPVVGQDVCACCVLSGLCSLLKGFMCKGFGSDLPHKLDQSCSFEA